MILILLEIFTTILSILKVIGIFNYSWFLVALPLSIFYIFKYSVFFYSAKTIKRAFGCSFIEGLIICCSIQKMNSEERKQVINNIAEEIRIKSYEKNR